MGNRGTWRGGRVVEGAALEMLLCGNVYEGSNPSLSVDKVFYKPDCIAILNLYPWT